MDKQQFLMSPLAKFLQIHVKTLDAVVQQENRPQSSLKADGSPVTELDHALSNSIEELMMLFNPSFTYYSEENFSDWSFPLIAVDPLDGTIEFIKGRNEWSISIGIFQSEKFEGDGWIYNPMTKEVFSETELIPFKNKNSYCGEISRSEWEKDLFTNKKTDKFDLRPMGSIAYKLGRLSSGKCDFVVSLKPKNIWDVAGGTLLCKKAGYRFYSQGKEVTSVEKIYQPPLIWCHSSLFDELSKIYP